MKKVWKWIIGIVLGLILLAVLVGAGYLLRSNFHAYRAERFEGGIPERVPGLAPFDGFGYHLREPVQFRHGVSRIGGFIGELFSIGFLTLIVLGIIWLVNSIRTPKHVEASAAVPAAVANPCKKCGKPLQSYWTTCPYCGKKV